jgi:hypothetical protein
VYLLDEALELWTAIMNQTPRPASPDILALLPGLFPILEAATDNAPQALQIVESYILLSPQHVLSDQIRFQLLVSLESLLNSTTRQRIGVVPHLVSMLIRATDTIDNGSENSYNVITKSLIDSSFLESLLGGLHTAYEATQTTGPNRKTSSVQGVLETDYFSVLAHMALGNAAVFVSAVAHASGASAEQTLSWVLTEWFFHFDNIGVVTQKKLHALALTQLLSINGPNAPPPHYILAQLQSYFTMWTDIVTELAEGAEESDDPRNGDYLIFWNGGGTSVYHESEPPEVTRRRDWESSDITHRLNMREFVKERLQAIIVACGGEQRFHEDWLVNIDRDVLTAFGNLGIL